MVCVYCGAKTQVSNSRLQKRSNQVWRRRFCSRCEATFTTHEAVDLSSTLLVDSGDSMKPFLPDMLFTEVLLALQDRKNNYLDAREVTNTVIKQLLKLPDKPIYKPQQISSAASAVLKRLDRRAWLRFVAEHPSLQA
jgi:transcriptional regulator NrdR family protein